MTKLDLINYVCSKVYQNTNKEVSGQMNQEALLNIINDCYNNKTVKTINYSDSTLTILYTDDTTQQYTISGGGESPVTVVQTTGNSTTAVMSQAATTSALNTKVINGANPRTIVLNTISENDTINIASVGNSLTLGNTTEGFSLGRYDQSGSLEFSAAGAGRLYANGALTIDSDDHIDMTAGYDVAVKSSYGQVIVGGDDQTWIYTPNGNTVIEARVGNGVVNLVGDTLINEGKFTVDTNDDEISIKGRPISMISKKEVNIAAEDGIIDLFGSTSVNIAGGGLDSQIVGDITLHPHGGNLGLITDGGGFSLDSTGKLNLYGDGDGNTIMFSKGLTLMGKNHVLEMTDGDDMNISAETNLFLTSGQDVYINATNDLYIGCNGVQPQTIYLGTEFLIRNANRTNPIINMSPAMVTAFRNALGI